MNCLFGSQSVVSRRIYFAPGKMLRQKALGGYLKQRSDANRVPDICVIDLCDVNNFVQYLDICIETNCNVEDVIKQIKIEFSSDKFIRFCRKIGNISFIHQGM